jgi:hypothetical protein
MIVSEYAAPFRRRAQESAEIEKVWLKSVFRAEIIKMGLEKAGSLNGLGRELGYRSRIHPGWSVLQILLGNQAFPADKLRRLADFINYPYHEILQHQTNPRRITPENTRDALLKANLWCYVPK